MTWVAPERNREGIQFANLRARIDEKFDNIHDELSASYYDGTPFRSFGILTKEKFDKLHGLIFHIRDRVFHITNILQLPKNRTPIENYNNIYAEDGITIIGTRSEKATIQIKALRTEGFQLIDLEE